MVQVATQCVGRRRRIPRDLTSYAARKSSSGFVFDTATSRTLPPGRSPDDTASSTLRRTDARFDATSTASAPASEEEDEGAALAMADRDGGIERRAAENAVETKVGCAEAGRSSARDDGTGGNDGNAVAARRLMLMDVA